MDYNDSMSYHVSNFCSSKRKSRRGSIFNFYLFQSTYKRSTAAVLALSILTDHWESIEYSTDKIVLLIFTYICALFPIYSKVLFFACFKAEISEKHNLTIRDYFGDKRVYVVSGGQNKQINENGSLEILLQMHGGLWWVCYDLTGIKFKLERQNSRCIYEN